MLKTCFPISPSHYNRRLVPHGLPSQIIRLDRTYHAHRFIFSSFFSLIFCLILYGGISRLLSSSWVHVKYIALYQWYNDSLTWCATTVIWQLLARIRTCNFFITSPLTRPLDPMPCVDVLIYSVGHRKELFDIQNAFLCRHVHQLQLLKTFRFNGPPCMFVENSNQWIFKRLTLR